MRSAVPLAVVAASLLWSCADGVDPLAAPGRHVSGSSIVLLPDQEHLIVTSPDDDRVVAVDAGTLDVIESVTVSGEPDQLLLLPDRLVVSLARGTGVAVVPIEPDGAFGSVTTITLPCGGTAGLAAYVSDGVPTSVFVACPHDDRVVELEPAAGAVRRVVAVPGRPTSVAVRLDELWVTTAGAGRVEIVSLRALAAQPRIAGSTAWSPPLPVEPLTIRSVPLESQSGFAASQAGALFADPLTDRVFGAFQRVDRDSDRDRPPEAGGYGSVIDDRPRIEPRLIGPCGPRYARYDGGVRALSGPSAVAYSPANRTLWVAHQYTDAIAVLACDAVAAEPIAPVLVESQDRLSLLEVFRVGRGPRGLTLSTDGRTAFVDIGFDHAVARLDLEHAAFEGEPLDYRDPSLERRRDLGATRLSERARRGRSLFYDAANTHMTPSGVVTCATCHPNGGDDGLTWFLHAQNGIGPKLRRTPAAWNADPDTAPLHWDGEFSDVASLTQATITGLLEGDGLLVDTEAVATYLEELEPPPGRPRSATEQLLVASGRALFEDDEVGCATCHSGDSYTDNRRHSVLQPATDWAARLDRAATPSLLGVRGRAPFFHDGRADSLDAVIGSANEANTHGRTSGLLPAQRAELIAFLESL